MPEAACLSFAGLGTRSETVFGHPNSLNVTCVHLTEAIKIPTELSGSSSWKLVTSFPYLPSFDVSGTSGVVTGSVFLISTRKY